MCASPPTLVLSSPPRGGHGSPETGCCALKQLPTLSGVCSCLSGATAQLGTSHCPHKAIQHSVHINPLATQAFRKLCHLFTSAPILLHPDPAKTLVMEVDASDVGPMQLLLQKTYSHTAALRCRDHELLAIKWALDHQNLITIQQAKQLNFRQVRWALFFEQLNFVIFYLLCYALNAVKSKY